MPGYGGHYSFNGLALGVESRKNRPTVPMAAGLVAFGDVGPRPRTCRWIDGEPRGAATVFCGAARDSDPDYTGCYCQIHRERSRGKPAAVILHHHRSKAGARA